MDEGFHIRDIEKLLREIVLPRLCELEQEVQLLRKTTWPVCQALRDHYSFKPDFSSDLSIQIRALVDVDEYRRLVDIKNELRYRYLFTSKQPPSSWGVP